jgi:uncharacterized membrane protein YbhN (UPF0104 family)
MWPLRKHLLLAVGIFIFLAFVIWLEYSMGWRLVMQSWQGVASADLMLAVAGYGVSIFFRAERVRSFFFLVNRPMVNRILLWHTFLNNLLPMRSGELSFPLLLRYQYGIPARRSLPGLLWFRYLDFSFILVLLALTLQGQLAGAWLYAPITVLLLLPVAIFMLRRWRFLLRRQQRGFSGKVVNFMRNGIPEQRSALIGTYVFTTLSWLSKLAAYSILFHAFSGLPWEQSLQGVIGGELSSILPIHGLAGAGTYEAGSLLVLQLSAVHLGTAVTAAVNLHIFILIVSALGFAATMLNREFRRGFANFSLPARRREDPV